MNGWWKKEEEGKKRKRKKNCEKKTADTDGEGETLPDPQRAEVPAWEKEEKKDRERESQGEYVAWVQ